jgi:hypothetical protein
MRLYESRGPGSIPGGDIEAGVAQLAAHRTRNAARVSSTLTAGSESGVRCQELRSREYEVCWCCQRY